jgi:hypothetical protein
MMSGHVFWQGRPAQPSPGQQVPITLTLRPATGGAAVEYSALTTDASGVFTVNVSSLVSGNYLWRTKGTKHLANSGPVTLTGVPLTAVEMGQMLVGDCNDDNVVSSPDFSILKGSFGKSIGQPGYDDRAEFTGDDVVNSTDFSLLRVNFGTGGAAPIGPSGTTDGPRIGQ